MDLGSFVVIDDPPPPPAVPPGTDGIGPAPVMAPPAKVAFALLTPAPPEPPDSTVDEPHVRPEPDAPEPPAAPADPATPEKMPTLCQSALDVVATVLPAPAAPPEPALPGPPMPAVAAPETVTRLATAVER